VPCATPPAAENCMSRTTAISPHHPAISTRRRGRGAGRFHTRSKRPATPRGECDGRLLCSGPARHAHALVSQGDARTSARARVRTSHARAAAAASTRQVVLGHQPVRQQNNTRGSRTSAPRAPMGSPPAADTLVRWFSAINPSANKTTQKACARRRRGRHWAARPRQTRAPVCCSRRAQCGGAGAALPRCPGPRSADLKRAPSNFSKSGRDGRRGAAAQHTHYGAVHMDAGQPRAMRSSSAPPGACSARSRAPHALSSRFSPRFSSRFSERQTRAIFPPKKISTILL